MKNWRRVFKNRWSIETKISSKTDLSSFLWTTRCSKTKSRISCGTPDVLYQSPLNLYFYRTMEERSLPYGILSDKYGLHMSDEIRDWYDVHPSALSDADKKRLGRKIQSKLKARGFQGIVFYNNSPLRSVPYLEILSFAELPVIFTTRLPPGNSGTAKQYAN